MYLVGVVTSNTLNYKALFILCKQENIKILTFATTHRKRVVDIFLFNWYIIGILPI